MPPCDPRRVDNGPPPDLQAAETCDKGHGCFETRRIAVTAEAVEHLDWPGLAQFARLTRTRQVAGKTSVETVYMVVNLPPGEADPVRLPALSLAHWGVENRLHYVRDISMDEDRCRVRSGARALAGVRNTALSIIRRLGRSDREARESVREDRAEAIRAVTGRNL
ncbi:MAG TPA: ISAs1 family transposase [Hyphomicrobiaceae bacterium]|nr:ISAs1 family transposase [Hyphomicrobiaceae bacterium]